MCGKIILADVHINIEFPSIFLVDYVTLVKKEPSICVLYLISCEQYRRVGVSMKVGQVVYDRSSLKHPGSRYDYGGLLAYLLPLPAVLVPASQGSGNKFMAEALTGVQRELIRGEGLSKPMSKRPLFLPLMVQMTGVGEETGNLDNTLTTVAESYEMEADDRTNSAVGLIQPIITIVIGLVVGFLALSLVSAMYSVYGQL